MILSLISADNLTTNPVKWIQLSTSYMQQCRMILSPLTESFRADFIHTCQQRSITSLFGRSMQKLWVTLICVSGSDRFYLNIEDMIGYKPVFFIKWCWMILTPGICAVSPLQTQNQQQQSHQQQQTAYQVVAGTDTYRRCSCGVIQLYLSQLHKDICSTDWYLDEFNSQFYTYKQNVIVVCHREFSCSSWLNTNRWSTTTCTPTLTGATGSAGSWPCPRWSASHWGLSGWSGRLLAPSLR